MSFLHLPRQIVVTVREAVWMAPAIFRLVLVQYARRKPQHRHVQSHRSSNTRGPLYITQNCMTSLTCRINCCKRKVQWSIVDRLMIYIISFVCREWVNKQETDEVIPIGFDMEWPFNFVTGPGRTAVIQLCADVGVCYVFHVFNLKKLPTVLVALLTHDKVCLHGVNIKK